MRSTSSALQEGKVVENVSQTAAVVAQQSGRAISSLWNMSKKAYVSVASSVETAARDSGYQINLGAKDIERTIGEGTAHPGYSASDSNLAGMGNGGDAHHFAGGWGGPAESSAEHRSVHSGMEGNGYSSGAAHSSSNFAGFDDGNGADGMWGGLCSCRWHSGCTSDDAWGTWDAPKAAAKPPSGRGTARGGSRGGSKAGSGGAGTNKKWADDEGAVDPGDDWGKW